MTRLALLALAVFLAGPADAHGWYTGQHSPNGHGRCCDETDCGSVDPRKVRCAADGCTVTLGVGDLGLVTRAGRYWFPGQPMPSPDMQMHACYWPTGGEQDQTPPGYVGVLRCLWWGGGA